MAEVVPAVTGAVELDRQDNLGKPVPGDHGAHGTFGDRASTSSAQLWANMNRKWLALAAGVLTGPTLGVLAQRQLTHRKQRKGEDRR